MFDDWYESHEGRAEEPRELKVRLPLWMHMKMHGIKLVHDQNLSQIVEHALRYWLDAVERGVVAPDDPCTPPPGQDATAPPAGQDVQAAADDAGRTGRP